MAWKRTAGALLLVILLAPPVAGQTPTAVYANLIAISADQKVRANVAFRVVADPGSANKASRELQPTTHTNLKLFGNRVVAVGPTRRVEEAVDVQNAADTFSPRDQPPINDATIFGSHRSISEYVLPRCRARTFSAWASGRQVALSLAAVASRWMPS